MALLIVAAADVTEIMMKPQAYGHLWTWGGGDLIARKELHNAPKLVSYKRIQNRGKTKTLSILTSNERIIISKLQLNPNFSNLRGKRQLVPKMGYFK